MDKQTLVRDLKSHVGGAAFINQTQMAKYLKRSREAIPGLLKGLDYLETGREKKYFIPDIAARLLEIRC
ncbi:MAG: hypothetical protein PHG06_14935 [Parabacteroides sp.]|nr:hypothetical protein [Parabacteroides sp.]